MTDQATNPSLDEVPFKAFKTDFAKRICKIAGVQELLELISSPITGRFEDRGMLTTVVSILHFEESTEDPELIILFLENCDYINQIIVLHNSQPPNYFSGWYEGVGNTDDLFHRKGSIGIGSHDRLLVTLGGHIADTEEVT